MLSKTTDKIIMRKHEIMSLLSMEIYGSSFLIHVYTLPYLTITTL
jgi:hypothetical protein